MINKLLVILLVLIPVYVFVRYIYYRDKIEKEPKMLIIILFILGIITVYLSNYSWNFIVSKIPEIKEEIGNDNKYIKFLISYGEIGFIEETIKYIILVIIIYRNKNYNYEYDGIVYATAISLGFAFVEGIKYGMMNNLFITLVRSILTIPMHAVYGILMGYYLSKSKKNIQSRSFYYMYMALLVPIFIHGTSDYLLSTLNQKNLLIYIIYAMIIYIIVLKKIDETSRLDRTI